MSSAGIDAVLDILRLIHDIGVFGMAFEFEHVLQCLKGA